jgi:hypothetical protein
MRSVGATDWVEPCYRDKRWHNVQYEAKLRGSGAADCFLDDAFILPDPGSCPLVKR